MPIPLENTATYPPQIKFMIGNEACERFSFYGMRSILTIFMVSRLAIPAPDAKATYHLFVSACYLFPLLGGYLADRFLGKYRTILYLSLLYCAGHATLALWETRAGLYWGLALIALGSGGIKPCVSSFIGDQFTDRNRHLVKGVFHLFYFSVNFGSFFSTLLIPVLLPRFGARWAFGLPGLLMGLATLIFWSGSRHYAHLPPTARTGARGLVPILAYSLSHLDRRKRGQALLDVASARFTRDEVEAAKSVLAVFKVLITVSAFWALFDQHGSSWVLQAKQMDLDVLGVRFQESQIAALNPIMVMGLIPLFTWVVYPAVARLGIEVTPLRKMGAGMVLVALSFAAVGLIQIAIDSGARVSVAWQFIPYLILTAAEVLVSITGLEFAYTQAPLSMKGTMMSLWQLTVFVGNLLTAYVSKVSHFTGASFFFFFATTTALLAGVFILGAIRYEVRDFVIRADPGPAAGEAASP